MYLLLAIALFLWPVSTPSVNARAYCIDGLHTHSVGFVSTYTAGTQDELVTVVVTFEDRRTNVGRQVFVPHGQPYSVSLDLGEPAAPRGVRVHWSGLSGPHALPWSVTYRTSAIAC